MSDLAEILEWVAFGGSLTSLFFYGKKGLKGPCVGIGTSFAFIAYGFAAEVPAAIISNCVFMALHIKNLRSRIMGDENRQAAKIAKAMNTIVEASHGASRDAGWWTNIETSEPLDVQEMVPTKLMLIVSEVAEAMEGHRKGLSDDHLKHRTMVEVELADAVIRIADLAGALGFDLGGAVAEKMAYNASRPDHKLANRVKEGGKTY